MIWFESPVKPTRVRLEASSRCQLRCPSCPTATKAIRPVVGSGALKFIDFEKFLLANPAVRTIELSNYGEVFLNPELLDIMRLSHERGVTLSIDNGVNLNHVSDEVLEGLVKYRITEIRCSIDGTSQETYRQYRIGGDYERVILNIKRINHYKKASRSLFPKLTWQFIIFGHNEHEIPEARKLARELDMNIAFKLNWDSDFSPIRDPERVKQEAGLLAASRNEYRLRKKIDYGQQFCSQLWERPQINWDGKNLGCCRNFWGDFGGNYFTDGVSGAANHEKIRYARSMLFGKKPARVDIPCTTCSIYLEMGKEGRNFLKRLLLRQRLARWGRNFFRVGRLTRATPWK